MSEVAGRLATQMGAWALEKAQGGRGILLGGVPGVPPAKVVVLGGGIVGYNAALIAVGMQADVWVLDKSVERMRDLEMMLDGRITLAMSNQLAIEEAVADADLDHRRSPDPGRAGAEADHPRDAAGAQAGRRARRRLHRPGRLLRDLPPDDAFRPGLRCRRDRPLLRLQHAGRGAGHLHLCRSRTSRSLRRADRRPRRPRGDRPQPPLARGVNVFEGKLTYEAVAEAHGLEYSPLDEVLPLEAV